MVYTRRSKDSGRKELKELKEIDKWVWAIDIFGQEVMCLANILPNTTIRYKCGTIRVEQC